MVIKKCSNFIKGMSEKTQVKLAQLMTFYVSLQLMVCNAFANSNTGQIDGFIDFACDWLTKIGGVVALVGGVMFALGWQREDAEGKTRGLQTMMAGFMLVAIAASKGLFGL